jgi:3',5'-cyclic AMP phosphodiesterase CpdA
MTHIKRRCFLSGLPAAVLATPALAAGRKSIRFVQLTDTHFGQRNHDELTARLIQQINQLPLKINFAVHTGDIFNDAILDDATVRSGRSVMAKLKVPVHYVPGNHDILRKNHAPTKAAYERYFGKLIEAHEYGDLGIITCYTEPLAGSFKVPGYNPLAELDSALRTLAGKSVIVCHHTPCVGNFYNNRSYQGWPPNTREKWTQLLNRYGVTAVLAGHFHRDELFWLDQVPLYIAPPVSRSWGRQPAYRIYTLKDGRLSYRTQYFTPAH